MNYYNEIDSHAAQWLRTLISANLIPQGDVDTRSITEVTPNDLRNYTQCHFFAGIGGWSLALQLAGISATTPLWTGSCPCQPFSTAGKGLAQQDERHLWPVFFDLIRQCRPEHIFGEQVASAIGHGWLDGVSADLEAEGYACGATVLGAHSVNSPHQRQRLYWVADSKHERLQRHGRLGKEPIQAGWKRAERHGAESGAVSGLVLSDRDGCGQGRSSAASAGYGNPTDSTSVRTESRRDGKAGTTSAESGRREVGGCWSDFQLVHCRDGKTRRIPTEPAFFPLAHGVPARVVRLRGYGNAIVPQVAAEFIQAFYETKIQETQDADFC